MKKLHIYRLLLLLCCNVLFQNISSYVVNDTTFLDDITAIAYDKSGKIIIGSETEFNDEEDTERPLISYIQTTHDNLENITVNTIRSRNANETISCMSIARRDITDPSSLHIAYTLTQDPAELHIINLEDFHPDTLTLNDNSGFETNGVVALESSSDKVFAAVKESEGDFGDTNSGVRMANLTFTGNNPNTPTEGTFCEISPNENWVKGSAGSNPNIENSATLKYIPELDRLYLGLQVQSHAEAANDGARALVILDPQNFTNGIPLANNDHLFMFDDAQDLESSNIVGVNATESNNDTYFYIRKIDYMVTPHGNIYLIVNGGLDAVGDTGLNVSAGCVYALPLVGKNGDIPGSLAHVLDRNSGLVDFMSTALSSQNLFNQTSTPAFVGSAALPFDPGSEDLNDLHVQGDTVFCATNEGLFYSTANIVMSSQIQNQTHDYISHWSPWARFVPNTTAGTDTDGSCSKVAFDPITGRTCIIPTEDANTIRLTKYNKSEDTTTLEGAINFHLKGPAYSFLELNTDIFPNYYNDYSFFIVGGRGTVVFAYIVAPGEGPYRVHEWNTEDTVTAISEGLPNAPVTALNWSNQSTENLYNHLFAGTTQGLYALVDVDNTGSRDDIGSFVGRSWKKIEALGNESIKKIVTPRGGADNPSTIVLTETIENNKLVNKLWVIITDENDTLEEVNNSATLVYNTSSNSINEAQHFWDIETMQEYLIVATDRGLQSVLLEEEETPTRLNLDKETNDIRYLFTNPREPLGHSLYAATYKTVRHANSNVGYSAIGQITFEFGEGTLTPHILKPFHKLAEDNNNNATDHGHRIHAFYTNGGTYFFSQTAPSANHTHQFITLPYNNGTTSVFDFAPSHDVTTLNQNQDTDLYNQQAKYFITHLGSGHFVAGTNSGIVALY